MGFIEGFVNGFAQAVAGGRIERLCSELGWGIDGRKGKTVKLLFNCPVIGNRMVFISNGDEALVLFAVYSSAVFDSRRVPDVPTNFALVQNDKAAMGKWEVTLEGDNLLFRLTYAALGDGLTAAAMKLICNDMLGTAADFDAKMKEVGYL
ncbi:MAG TPA: hypothetical protein VHI52_22905 [Verrucomicrobiae bacterium]|nr:hypothetical protein [Verrucomicrobiae bacterium]